MGLFASIADRLAGRAAVQPAGMTERVEPRLDRTPSASGGQDLQHPEQWLVTSVGGGRSAAGVAVSESTALTLPAVMQAVRVLTGVFAMTPLIYYRRLPNGGRERATDNPLYTLFHDRPGHQTPFAFKELLLADILLQGRYGAYISRDLRQRPAAVTRVDPAGIAVAKYFDRREGMTLFYDATLPDGSRERFSGADFWYVPGFTRDGITGLPPIRYMRDALGAALATSDFAARYWRDDARPGLVLSTEQKVTPDDRDKIKRDWKAKFAGNNHDVAVLDQSLKPVPFTNDNEKSQFIETRAFQVVDVARAFGVPPHLIFELSKATFSNIEHQSLEFVTYHMMPHYERVAQAANITFAEDGHYFEFLPDALLRGDIKTRWEAYKIQREIGVVNGDEIRAAENRNPIGGDAGSEFWRPLNYGRAGDPPPAPARRESETED